MPAGTSLEASAREDPAPGGESVRSLLERVDALPDALRNVLRDRAISGLSLRDIAEARGLTPAVVRERLTAARKALQGDPPVRVIQCVADGGPEITAFGQTSGDTYGTDRGNKGCYGADLRYDFTVINTGDQTYPMYAYAQGRDVDRQGSGYFGPCSILSPGSYTKRGITRLRCDGPCPQAGDYASLTTSNGSNEVAAQIPQDAELTYRVGAAVAGAATTPFNLVMRGLAYTLTEPPEN
jgi:hypothetical protein